MHYLGGRYKQFIKDSQWLISQQWQLINKTDSELQKLQSTSLKFTDIHIDGTNFTLVCDILTGVPHLFVTQDFVTQFSIYFIHLLTQVFRLHNIYSLHPTFGLELISMSEMHMLLCTLLKIKKSVTHCYSSLYFHNIWC